MSLTGKGASWQATIRPPETAAEITMTVAADAFTEGNAETEIDIRISTGFPDTDAETPTTLFSHGITATRYGITITENTIDTLRHTGGNKLGIDRFQFDGTSIGTTHEIAGSYPSTGNATRGFDSINGDYLFSHNSVFYRINGLDFSSAAYIESTGLGRDICHTDFGFMFSQAAPDSSRAGHLQLTPYSDLSERHEFSEIPFTFRIPSGLDYLASQGDLVYIFFDIPNDLKLYRLTSGTEIEFVRELNVDVSDPFAIRGDTLYTLTSSEVQTLDIRPYRPLAKNTKTTIYPVFANEGDTLDLTQYSPDAERIVADIGFDKPTYLTINASNELTIDADAVTETHARLHTP